MPFILPKNLKRFLNKNFFKIFGLKMRNEKDKKFSWPYGKEIFSSSIFFTTKCNLNCKYCFVTNKSEAAISKSILEKVINVIIFSSGNRKIIKISGGEPLLESKLLKHCINLIKELSNDCHKEVLVFVASNGTLFTRKIVKFFENNNVYCGVSIDGKKEVHDKYRRTKNGKGTFTKIVKNLSLFSEDYKKNYLRLLMSVHPNEVDKLIENYKFLLSLGFTKDIQVTPVFFVKWSFKDVHSFIKKYTIIKKFYHEKLHKDSIIRFDAKRGPNCIFYNDLVFNTNGDIAFCSFVNNKIGKKFIIGNINNLPKKYFVCSFNPTSEKCILCKKCNHLCCRYDLKFNKFDFKYTRNMKILHDFPKIINKDKIYN